MKNARSGANFAEYTLGALTVVALRDGYVDMPASRLRRTDGQPLGDDLAGEVELQGGRLRLSVNAFLVVDGEERILIDTGASNTWHPTMGLLLGALGEAGIARESIGTVALTHTHLDHANGLVARDGTDAFPNLERLLVPAAEVGLFDAVPSLARFRSRRTPLEGGFRLSPSVTAVAAHGHEVGHTAFEVTSGGETLTVWGDIVHVPSIQFARPELTWEFDADQAEARATRAGMLARVARPAAFVAGAHLDFPGVGAVSKAGEAYAFTPV